MERKQLQLEFGEVVRFSTSVLAKTAAGCLEILLIYLTTCSAALIWELLSLIALELFLKCMESIKIS